jgi:hypothetical protein
MSRHHHQQHRIQKRRYPPDPFASNGQLYFEQSQLYKAPIYPINTTAYRTDAASNNATNSGGNNTNGSSGSWFNDFLAYLQAVNAPPDINVQYPDAAKADYTPLYFGITVFALFIVASLYFASKK